MAKKGEIRTSHFAHHDLRECRHALEASLFGMFTRVVSEAKIRLRLPAVSVPQEVLKRFTGQVPAHEVRKIEAAGVLYSSVSVSFDGAEIRCKTITDSFPAEADVFVPQAGLHIHLLFHRKSLENIKSATSAKESHLVLDLKAYAKLWWETCDRERAATMADAVSATDVLAQWISDMDGGKIWVHHAEASEKLEAIINHLEKAARDWSILQGEQSAARLRAEQAERSRKQSELEAYKAEQHRRWRESQDPRWTVPDSDVPETAGHLKLVGPNHEWLSELSAREAGLCRSDKYRSYGFFGKSGDVVPDAARYFIPIDGNWIRIGNQELSDIREIGLASLAKIQRRREWH